MKKVFFYIVSIVIGASIPIYFFFMWEPLTNENAISVNATEVTEKETLNNEDSNIHNEEVVSEKTNKSNEDDEDITNENEEKIKLKQGSISNGLFLELEKDKKEELDKMLKKLSVMDIIKINNYFSDSENKSNIKSGILLIKERMSSGEYNYFKNIIMDYIDLEGIGEI